jgi:hypothetical protein
MSDTLKTMNGWQFSVGNLLTITVVMAMWMWAIVAVPVEPSLSGQFFRVAMATVLAGFTCICHRLFRSIQLSWPGAAMLAGFIALLSMLFLAIDNHDWSVLQRWR